MDSQGLVPCWLFLYVYSTYLYFEQEERLSPEIKRSRIDDETLEETVTGNTVHSGPAAEETHGTESRKDNEPITIESPTISRSQEDVMIVGDVQVARPEVIDLEKLPTIRQGTTTSKLSDECKFPMQSYKLNPFYATLVRVLHGS